MSDVPYSSADPAASRGVPLSASGDAKKSAGPARWARIKRFARGLHRDMGALAVGLTLVYAISGLAVNHVADWDPSFTPGETYHYDYYGPFSGSVEARADAVLAAFGGEREEILELYPSSYAEARLIGEIQITTESRTLTIGLNPDVVPTRLEISRSSADGEEKRFEDFALSETPEVAAAEILALFDDASGVQSYAPLKASDMQVGRFLNVRSGDAEYAVNVLSGVPVTVDVHPQPRFFLAAANWLHTNRGKAAWTWFADGYAIVLILLALSGILLLPKGRKGLLGRGGVLLAVGILIPLVFFFIAQSQLEESKRSGRQSSDLSGGGGESDAGGLQPAAGGNAE